MSLMEKNLPEENVRPSYVDVYFPDGCNQRTIKGLYQYDHGLILRIKGLSTMKVVQTQFAYAGLETAVSSLSSLSGDVLESDIPDVVLLQPKEVTCYIYLEDESSGVTVKEIRMPLTPRPEPADISLTPDQIGNYNKLIAQLNELIDRMVEANSKHPIIQNGTWWVWDIETQQYIDTGDIAKGDKGQDGISPTVVTAPIEGGNKITITDKNGEQSIDVMDGVKGDTGNPGVYVGPDPVPEGTHVQVDPPAKGDVVSVPEVFQEFGDSTVDTMSQGSISKEFMKPEYRNLIVTASKNSLGGYTADYSSSEIRNFVNGGGTVELRYSDTELGDQIYQYESFKDNVAYFRRNVITEDTAERINIGVHYDKSIQVDRIFLNWKTLIKALEDRIANIENAMTKTN